MLLFAIALAAFASQDLPDAPGASLDPSAPQVSEQADGSITIEVEVEAEPASPTQTRCAREDEPAILLRQAVQQSGVAVTDCAKNPALDPGAVKPEDNEAFEEAIDMARTFIAS